MPLSPRVQWLWFFIKTFLKPNLDSRSSAYGKDNEEVTPWLLWIAVFTIASLLLHHCFTAIKSPLHAARPWSQPLQSLHYCFTIASRRYNRRFTRLLLAALPVFVHTFDVKNYHGYIVCMIAHTFEVAEDINKYNSRPWAATTCI